ncbi:MAG TPA: hypothetical protein DCE71_05130 [Parachlamydiales bacterium]|nr:hypothetical protein [Parachlamydiales bacterium]
MFPPEGGTSCDHRVTAIALITIAALTSFLLFSTAIGIGLSLISAGLIVWVLADQCSTTDWSKCGETAIDLLALFAEAGNSSTQEGRQERGRRVQIENSHSATLNSYEHSSERTRDRREASPPRSFDFGNGPRVPVHTSTPSSSGTPGYRLISKAPETERGPRVSTPNAAPSLTPSQGSQQVKMPNTAVQTQGARVGLGSTETPSAPPSARLISNAPETERGARVPTPNAPATLAPPPGSQLVKGAGPTPQPQGARVSMPNESSSLSPGFGLPITSAGTNHSEIAARVGVGGGISPSILPFLASKIPSKVNQ